MSYQIMPFGEFWNNGVFSVPKEICEKSISFSNEIQLKVLLLTLSNGGRADVKTLSSRLKKDESEIEECLEFWVNEGIMQTEKTLPKPAEKPKKEENKKEFEALPMPSLTPKDIVVLCSENPELADLLRNAELILASSLSNAMKSNLINMVNYYGLPVAVVITLLEFYKRQRDNGKNISTRALQGMAKDWAKEDINTLDKASEKLKELEDSEELWGDVISLCEFEYRKPTSSQLKMLSRWSSDFSKEMIFFACNSMKKYNDEEKRSVKIVDNILKEWKRKGFKTPDDVKAPRENEKDSSSRLKSKPSFDIDEISQKAILNDDFDI